MQIALRYLAHTRSGDKGNIFNVAVFAYAAQDYAALAEQLTPDCVHAVYRMASRVDRYLAPNLHGMNFVMHDALAGGVSRTLALDNYGKAMASAILRVPIELAPERARAVMAHFGGA